MARCLCTPAAAVSSAQRNIGTRASTQSAGGRMAQTPPSADPSPTRVPTEGTHAPRYCCCRRCWTSATCGSARCAPRWRPKRRRSVRRERRCRPRGWRSSTCALSPHSSILGLFCGAHGALIGERHCCRQQQLITHEMGRRLKQRMYESSVRHSHHLEQATLPRPRVCVRTATRSPVALTLRRPQRAMRKGMRRPSPCASWRVRAKCCRCRAHCGPPTGRSTRIRLAVTDADQRKGLVAR